MDRIRGRYPSRYTQRSAFIDPDDDAEEESVYGGAEVGPYPSRGDADIWMVKIIVRMTSISLTL